MPLHVFGCPSNFPMDCEPFGGWELNEFLGACERPTRRQGTHPLVLLGVFNLLHFPLMDVSFQWCVYYSQCLLNWTALSPRACPYPPLIGSDWQEPRTRGRLSTSQPQSITVSHRDPFLLQEISHSESELDMAAQPPGSVATAMNCSALSLLSGQPCPNSGPLKFLSHHK